MGDRVLMQIISGDEFGPVVYGHSSGYESGEIVRKLAERMNDRADDIDYSTARLVQEMTNGDEGDVGYGVWSASKKLTPADSHGDAGIVLIDCKNGHKCECFGGYLTTGEDGFPKINE